MANPFELDQYQALFHILLALGLGALIGVERERHRGEQQVLAGVRTYPLVSLTGAIAGQLATATQQPLLVSIGAFVVGGFALFMFWVRQRLGTTGLTSPIALFTTYFIGVLVGYGFAFEAIVAGVAVTFLLFTKERLHHLAKVLTPKEMEGALYFIVIAFILYPITPPDPIDPWGLFPLRVFLLIVILVSAFSFLSFLALRKWGTRRGFLFAGFLGGLVNSEAVTASLTQQVRRHPRLEDAARHGILLATSTMFLRNLLIGAIADPSLALLQLILIPLLGPFLLLSVWTLLSPSRTDGTDSKVAVESPFALRPAFKFALWFGLVSVVTLAMTRIPSLGEEVILVTALGGFVSAGAVTASMGSLVYTGNADPQLAALTAILASLVSLTNKVVITNTSAPRLAWRLLLPMLSAVIVGALLLFLTNLA